MRECTFMSQLPEECHLFPGSPGTGSVLSPTAAKPHHKDHLWIHLECAGHWHQSWFSFCVNNVHMVDLVKVMQCQQLTSTYDYFLLDLILKLLQLVEICNCYGSFTKVKVWVLYPIQQPGTYWNRPSSLPLAGVRPTQT